MLKTIKIFVLVVFPILFLIYDISSAMQIRIGDVLEINDKLGNVMASGDFDGDGYMDLAVSASSESLGEVNPVANAGIVHVLYGTSNGLKKNKSQIWHQDVPGIILEDAEKSDYFGMSLAAGDFNGDGCDDLAIGVPYEDVPFSIGAMNHGVVHVIYGSKKGLIPDNNQLWYQDLPGMKDASEGGDLFGSSLAAGNFDGDEYMDLAVGVVGEAGKDWTTTLAGAVHVIYGSSDGLTVERNELWHQDKAGMADEREFHDRFGGALAVGDFNSDQNDDLAVGVETEGIDTIPGAGAVHIIYGSGSGLTANGNKLWHQNINDVKEQCEDYDYFGQTLVSGDFNGDKYADLAVGIPHESIDDALHNAGAVHIFFGSQYGITEKENMFLYQGLDGLKDKPEDKDLFGRTLASGDFNADDYDDLIIGVKSEDFNNKVDTGIFHMLFGYKKGFYAKDTLWSQDTENIHDTCEDGDHFASALAAGDFNGDTYDDLAVSASDEDIESYENAGVFHVIYDVVEGESNYNDLFLQGEY